MLSLKKAADTENGWSLSEITTIHRVDGMRSQQSGAGYRPRPSLDGERIQRLFRTPEIGRSWSSPTDVFEETELTGTNVSERPRVLEAV